MVIHTVKKAKNSCGYTHGQIWAGCDLLGPGTLNLLYLMNKLMNWANFLHAGSDVIIFG